MSRPMIFAVLAAALLLFIQSPQALAQWKGKGEGGAVIARGNSDADTVNLKLEMATELDRWKHGFGIQALRATNDSDKTAERYAAFWQSDYKLDDRTYLFGGLRYEDDRFSYGEKRFVTLGLLSGVAVSIVHLESPRRIHVISFRRATRHEEIFLFKTL